MVETDRRPVSSFNQLAPSQLYWELYQLYLGLPPFDDVFLPVANPIVFGQRPKDEEALRLALYGITLRSREGSKKLQILSQALDGILPLACITRSFRHYLRAIFMEGYISGIDKEFPERFFPGDELAPLFKKEFILGGIFEPTQAEVLEVAAYHRFEQRMKSMAPPDAWEISLLSTWPQELRKYYHFKGKLRSIRR